MNAAMDLTVESQKLGVSLICTHCDGDDGRVRTVCSMLDKEEKWKVRLKADDKASLFPSVEWSSSGKLLIT